MKSRSLVPLLPTVVIAITTLMLISPGAGRASGGAHHTWFVAPTGADAGACTANSAAAPFATIQRALACAGDGDVVSLAPTEAAPYPGIGAIEHAVTIQAEAGASARNVEVDAGKDEASIVPGVEAALHGVTLNCLGNDCPGRATVTDEGSLTLTADRLTGNLSVGGAVLETTPAGSSTPASLQLLDSTISGNDSTSGGAIHTVSGAGATGALTLAVADSTIAGNSAQTVGGGIYFAASTPGSSASIVSSTITANGAQGGGGGIVAHGAITLDNTILAGNTSRVGAYAECYDESLSKGSDVVDGPAGHNLVGNPSGCAGLAKAADGDLVDATRPGLLALADNGGPIDTVALQSGSPAIGAGDPASCAAAPVGDRDQRGEARRSAARGCDIGAYDTAGKGGVVDHTFFVAPGGSDALACPANAAASPFATIQRALACASDGDVVKLAPTGTAPYPGIGSLTANVAIEAQQGANARSVTIDAGQGEATVAPGVAAAITGVTVGCPGNDCGGRPTVTDQGSLTLTADQLSGNLSTFGAVREITPAGSSTPAALRVIASTITGNAGLAGGAIDSAPGAGATGGVTLSIVDSTIAGNHAQQVGGGVYFNALTPGSSATIASSTITANSAPSGGGGVAATGLLTLADTILAGNEASTSPLPDCKDEGSPSATHILDGPGGHNVIGVLDGCSGLATPGSGDLAGSAGAQLDPKLGPLAFNGGNTETVPLLGASPAIGAGAAAACESLAVASKDERGEPRNAQARGACDAGAYDTGGHPPAESTPAIHAPAAKKTSESTPLRIKIKAKGAPTPALSETGALPAGVRFADNGDGSASIAGTPAPGSAGSYTVLITARNGVGAPASATLTLTVRP